MPSSPQEFWLSLRYVEINQRNLHQRIVSHVLDTVDMFCVENREVSSLQASASARISRIAVISAGFNQFAAHAHQVVDLLAYRSKLLDVFSGSGIEVVVNMFLDRFEHTAQRVDKLLVAVGNLDGNQVLRWMAISDRRFSKPSISWRRNFFSISCSLLQILVGMTKVAGILVGKTIHNWLNSFRAKWADVRLGAWNLTAKQIPYNLWVVGTHHQLEGTASCPSSLAFLLYWMLLRDEQVDNQCPWSSWMPTPPKCMMIQTMAQAAKATPAVINQPPITLNTPVTTGIRHSMVPCSISKWRTHSYHEGNVGGRKRQLEVGTDGDQHGSKYQVNGCTNHVESSTLLSSTSFLSKRLLIQFISAFGINCFNHESVAWQLRTITRAAEELPNISSPLVLTAQVNRSLDYVLCLLGCRHGDNHHGTGSEKKPGVVLALSINEVIINWSGAAPLAFAI